MSSIYPGFRSDPLFFRIAKSIGGEINTALAEREAATVYSASQEMAGG
jgi:hypothetical protein